MEAYTRETLRELYDYGSKILSDLRLEAEKTVEALAKERNATMIAKDALSEEKRNHEALRNGLSELLVKSSKGELADG